MKKTALLTLSIAAAIATSQAQTTEWSYGDCVDYARDNNISIKQSLLQEESADYSLEAAEAQWLPSLGFSTSHGFTNRPWGNGTKNGYDSSYGLNAGWTVYDGGARENTIKLRKVESSISRLSTAALFRTIETDILSTYINILYAAEAVGINKEGAEVSKAQSERARALMESGRLSRVDYQQFESQAEQDNYAVVTAQSTLDNQRKTLKTILELGLTDEIAVKQYAWDDAEVLAPAPPIEESYRMALATDVELAQNKLRQESADLSVKVAEASRYPSISLNAGVSAGYSAPGNSFGESMKRSLGETVGLSLSLPILDNKKTKTAVAQARIGSMSAALDTEARENEISQLIEGWYIELHSAQSRYIAGLEQVKATELSEDLINEQFKLGLVNTVELMTAHKNAMTARAELLQAKYMAMLAQKMIEYYRTATITMP